MLFSKSTWLLAALFLYSGFSCVKDPQDIPGGATSDSVFGFQGLLDNQQIHIEAGFDQWTAVPASPAQDSLLVYTSVISRDGCTGLCSPSWTFRLYQALPAEASELLTFNNTIRPGSVDLALSDQERDSFHITLGTHPDLFMNGYSYWEDLNNPAALFQSTFTRTLGYEDNLNVCFQSYAYTGCQYNQCLYFQPSTEKPCTAHLEAQLESARHLVLSVKPEGTAPFLIEWDNGETSSVKVVQIQDSVTAVYASVRVSDARGNRTDLSQTILIQNQAVDACYFPIDLESEKVHHASATLAAGDLEIIYLDPSGAEWRSTAGVQPELASATVSGVEYFGSSPFGDPAYKVTLSAHVLLTNAQTGEAKWFTSDQVVIPFSYPQ